MFAPTMLEDYQNRLKQLTEKRKFATDIEILELDVKIKETQFVVDYLLGKNDGKCDCID